MVDRVKQSTDRRGVDLLLDARGGRSWRDSYDCLAPTGRLAVFGLATAVGGGRWLGTARALLGVPWLRFNPLRLMNDNGGVFGVNIGHLWDQHDMIRNWMSQILAWQKEAKIKPVVDRSFAFAAAAAAHRHIEGRGNIGKVVLLPCVSQDVMPPQWPAPTCHQLTRLCRRTSCRRNVRSLPRRPSKWEPYACQCRWSGQGGRRDFVRSLLKNRERLDHMIIFNEKHLRRALSCYFQYYLESRTHLSLNKDCPEPPAAGKIVAVAQLGALHHRYERRAP
jgi:hypothetical protein